MKAFAERGGRLLPPVRKGQFLTSASVAVICCCLSGGIWIEIVEGMPSSSSGTRSSSSRSWDFDDNVQNYLMGFGYLPKSNIETGNLRTMEQLREAVKQLQSFANLEPTGDINRETMELMRKPRCGAPDLPGSSDFQASNTLSGSSFQFRHRRNRRFVIQGQKWENPVVTWR
ncbi:matrix metalloproteinase-2-like [Uranotaenia lowii]|uniref:matrix metalloproteinase-2-like n=1 Tax=Uranotaenia lowii TaxID=190385 RepID=UPI00247916F2|nr:matrix metalloproteinase-2-like [Uranotaenia lowii]XP_055594537.1 matrix metalloproteinase-2-like [Uranotaenia lowii]XP_055594538.1 matrix metalloproteinase-2-like [Uranotaenia lowii]XP_055594539.1 matrix metalloproteinase-2-like [Uranotaenia lowii]